MRRLALFLVLATVLTVHAVTSRPVWEWNAPSGDQQAVGKVSQVTPREPELTWVDNTDGRRWIVMDPGCSLGEGSHMLWRGDANWESFTELKPQLAAGVEELVPYFQTDLIWVIDSQIWARMTSVAQTQALIALMRQIFTQETICL